MQDIIDLIENIPKTCNWSILKVPTKRYSRLGVKKVGIEKINDIEYITRSLVSKKLVSRNSWIT